MNEILPVFDLVTEEISIETWILKIQEYAELYDWNEVALKHYALSKLVRKWKDALTPDSNRTWREWSEPLIDTFGISESAVSFRLVAQNYL